MDQEILIIGSSPAGLQAAANLADLGLTVHLVEREPFLGQGGLKDLPDYLENTRLLEIINHPRVNIWTNTELQKLTGKSGDLEADLLQHPRFVDLKKCTACGDCVDVCPIQIPGTALKAIYFGGQPDCAAIAKSGISPCSSACPAGIHVQGYVALVRESRFQEAYDLIQEALPFPSVCGRVCNHLCETACSRSQLDQAVNIMALKHYLADWAYDERPPRKIKDSSRHQSGKRIAVIGAGPAGLTAARDLARLGHNVKIFEATSQPGGMMRMGIPPHRVSYQQLEWEIAALLDEGIELQLNTRVTDIPGLFEKGFNAVLAAAGAGIALKPDIPNSDHRDNWLSLDFLERVSSGQGDNLTGRRVIVLGGGDVAIDAARSAVRLGAEDVKILCRGLRASEHELQAALEEGIEIVQGRVFQEIRLNGKKIEGVFCLEAEVGEIVNSKRQFNVLPGTDHLIPGDLLIWALGQRIDPAFLPDSEHLILDKGWLVNTDEHFMTPLEGLFAAGDFRVGKTTFVVDAVGEGHRAARSIHCYLTGEPDPVIAPIPSVMLDQQEMEFRLEFSQFAQTGRHSPPSISVNERLDSFQLVDLALTESQALEEAGRCLACGPCSECMACVEVCEPGAILHTASTSIRRLRLAAVLADEMPGSVGEGVDFIQLGSEDSLAGSAAVCQVLMDLQTRPGIPPIELFPRIQSARGETQKTGLVLCRCGGEISSAIDTTALHQEILNWPEIDYAVELDFSCTDQGARSIQEIARENQLDRIVLAACSCCSLDQVCFSCTYQRTRCKANLGIFSLLKGALELEFVNIREQCAWVHPRSRAKATHSARTLIRSSLARIQPGSNGSGSLPSLPKNVLIVGKGPSANYCQEILMTLGLDVIRSEIMAGDIVRVGGRYQASWPDEDLLADCLILAPGSRAELDHISRSVKLTSQLEFLSGPRIDLDPLDYGLVICPPELDPEISGQGAAAHLFSWIHSLPVRINQPSAVVQQSRCRACGTCREICGYGIPEKRLQADGGFYAYINPLLCKDCGTCAAHCPSGAINPGSHSEGELENILDRIIV